MAVVESVQVLVNAILSEIAEQLPFILVGEQQCATSLANIIAREILADGLTVSAVLKSDVSVGLDEEHIKQTVVNLYELFLNQADDSETYDAFFVAQNSALVAFSAIKDLLADTVSAKTISIINGYLTLVDQFQFHEAGAGFQPLAFFVSVCLIGSSVALAVGHPFAMAAASLVVMLFGIDKLCISILGDEYGVFSPLSDISSLCQSCFLKIKAAL
ncbi:hypothetical protein KFZ76_08600 [Methylovulum psychrotolerans]|uniref:hypothetical protein n=1 Tax=Methylovulum psychrotolerans TaxID=1704499 RepID=UPI001BFF0959|nr:hypothetical protein [Methylovulum psychrotolerans]MBT9097765.1 hypothetical protein [Methylovulum psychrotolerans]